MNFLSAAFSALGMGNKTVTGTLYLKDKLQVKFKDCELEIQPHSDKLHQLVISKLYEHDEENQDFDEYIVLLSPDLELKATSGGFQWSDEGTEMIFMTKDTEILHKIKQCIKEAKGVPKLNIQKEPPTTVKSTELQGNAIFNTNVHLFSFNVKDALFEPISDTEVKFEIIQTPTFQFFIKCSGEHNCCTEISHAMNPYFSQEKWCFLWNQFDQVLVSLAAVFDPQQYAIFRSQLQRILINQQNLSAHLNLSVEEIDYAQGATISEDVEMQEAEASESESDESEIEEIQEQQLVNKTFPSRAATRGKLSKLATAMKQYRAFVIRGSFIDVYNTQKQQIQHSTSLKLDYNPDHLQLHDSESKLITSNQDNVSMMDIERGQVVQSWDAPKQLKSLSTYHKTAQTTNESLFYGITKDRVILMDPRLSNLVANETSYKSKIDFTCISTNNENEIAVGNEQGEVKLYNALGVRAKTNLKLGGTFSTYLEKLTALDIHEDGKWILGTCNTHLLLIKVDMEEDKNGFNKTMPLKQRNAPIKLSLRPDHVNQLGLATIQFTPAKFYGNFIMSSTGKYIFAWDFKKSKIGKNAYQIQAYDENVVGEQSYHGQVVVALQEELVLANKKEFTTPQKLFADRDSVVKTFGRNTRSRK